MKRRRTLKRKTKKRTTKKGAFGGYKICFKGKTDSLQNVFGNRPIAPSLMTKKLWAYVKRKRLATH